MRGRIRRGVAGPLSEALLIVVGIIVTLLLASTVFSKISLFQSKIDVLSSQLSQAMNEKFTYVYATFNESDSSFIIYLKNTGEYPIYSLDKFTVVFGSVGSALYYPYNEFASTNSSSWRYVELGNKNGVWDPGETLEIIVYNSTTINPPFFFKLTTANGNSVQVEFSLTPR